MKSTRKIRIGNKTIGYGEPVFIIAEAGVNHNGEAIQAIRLVDIAADAGADAVKFQTFRAEQVVVESGEIAEYQKENIGEGSASWRSQREMLRELELKEEFYPALIERAKDRGIIFFSTPHGGRASVDFLESVGVTLYKVGSGDLTNYLLLDRLAETRKPIIISTGMAYMDEVKDAVRFIRERGVENLVVLHCTTNYPCPPEEVNLAAMEKMMEELDAIVGFSDHTQGEEAALMATALGTTVYERHFTIDKSLPGPDHVASDSPEELTQKIVAIRSGKAVAMNPVVMGSAEKKPTRSELVMLPLVRRSIVAARDMEAGHIIEKSDLEAKRPGDGTSPTEFEKFIGKKLKQAVPADHQLQFTDLE